MADAISILWLRRDLRLHDHAALAAALKQKGQMQPVFIFDSDILVRFKNPLDKRISFIAETIFLINKELKKHRGELLVFYGKPAKIIPEIAAKIGTKRIFASEDFEPETIKRDKKVAALLKKNGRELILVKDHLIKAPHEVLKKDGTAFKVFTPYSKAWLAKLKPEDLAEKKVNLKGRLAAAKNLKTINISSTKEMLKEIGYEYSDLNLWPPKDAKKRLGNFVRGKLTGYKQSRNFPAIDGTSKLSPYLRFGLISIRECMRAVYGRPNSETWVNELIWREFYAMILYFYPETPQEEFQGKYRGKINWEQNQKLFEKWQNGETGFPIVDAAMKQLKTDWWMHNRARMITASFLTKDLLIDWRMGEEHFAQYLMDYEMASNVGGWQWAASTGTDAQPYFRVFNPTTQGKKFDPKKEYMKKYGAEELSPIVDHAKARLKAIRIFKEAK